MRCIKYRRLRLGSHYSPPLPAPVPQALDHPPLCSTFAAATWGWIRNSLPAMPGKPGSALPPGCFFSDAVKMAPHSSSSSCWCGLSRWILPCLHLLDESSAELLNFFPGRTSRADQDVLSLPFGRPAPPPLILGLPATPAIPPSPADSSPIFQCLFSATGGCSTRKRAHQCHTPSSTAAPLCLRSLRAPGALTGAVPSLSLSLSPARPVTQLPLAQRERRCQPRGFVVNSPGSVECVQGRTISDRKPGAAGGPPSPGQDQPWLLGSSCHGSSPAAGDTSGALWGSLCPGRGRSRDPQGWLSPSAPHQGLFLSSDRPLICHRAPRRTRPSHPQAGSPGTASLSGLC